MNPLALYIALLVSLIGHGFLMAQTADIHAQRSYHKNGQLIEKYEYYFDYWSEQQVRHGRLANWSSDGILRYESEYQDGQLSGTERVYDRRGKLIKQRSYLAGQLDGLSIWYRPNGRVKRKTYYRNGRKHGTSVWYDKEGDRKRQKEYSQGTLIDSTDETPAP